MQYILSQEEYDALRKKQEKEISLSEKKLQKLCTEIADTMPIQWGWGQPEPKPWGCIFTQEDDWYCDQCPVQDICPNPYKHWSK